MTNLFKEWCCDRVLKGNAWDLKGGVVGNLFLIVLYVLKAGSGGKCVKKYTGYFQFQCNRSVYIRHCEDFGLGIGWIVHWEC